MTRQALIKRHNPVLTAISTDSPLSVGNGDFCFTADITGMQTLYDTYSQNHFPLCIMSNWGWHTAPTESGKIYEWEDLQLTEYDHAGRKVSYPTEAKPGNEEIYHWLRHNPHKFNLGRIGLFYADGSEISPTNITNVRQELDLYAGVLYSKFTLDGKEVEVTTVCDAKSDTIAFKVQTLHEGITIQIKFPYGHHGTSGSDWESADKHTTEWHGTTAHRKMDDVEYFVDVQGSSYCFSPSHMQVAPCFDTVLENARREWENFWQAVKLYSVPHEELERRMILSLYLMRIQAMGGLPTAETGLTVNSWYGRFHSEMYLWNMAYLPLWGLGEKLMPSLHWYKSVIPQAKALAESNGYAGIRWAKQTAITGRDAPSPIAPLLVWQQPHIIYMLELLYQNTYPTNEFLHEHWHLVESLADFMVSFLHLNKETERYEMLAPIIPAQEVHDLLHVKSPMFEMEYFRFGLLLACEWGKRLGYNTEKYAIVMENIAEPVIKDGLYLAHAFCPDTYEKFNKDHPMMVGAYGLFKSPKVDPDVMRATLKKILECWEHESMWGWDYAMLAMCAIALGEREPAIALLLSDNPKNQYVVSGNNYQKTRTDLPLYLPGNGALLLVLPMLANSLQK